MIVQRDKSVDMQLKETGWDEVKVFRTFSTLVWRVCEIWEAEITVFVFFAGTASSPEHTRLVQLVTRTNINIIIAALSQYHYVIIFIPKLRIVFHHTDWNVNSIFKFNSFKVLKDASPHFLFF